MLAVWDRIGRLAGRRARPVGLGGPRSVGAHPAGRAWRRLSPDKPLPLSIDVLAAARRARPAGAAVYRLNGAGIDGQPVVAKRLLRHRMAVERRVYDAVLPRLPVASLRCYGAIPEPDGHFGWLFIEDAGGQPYDPSRPELRTLASEWFGRLLTLSASLGPTARLPAESPERFHGLLRQARQRCEDLLADPGLGPDVAGLLEVLLRHCADIGAHWQAIERLCLALPPCLVHGDFNPGNARVRVESGRPTLYPYDWEGAGWGVPARDLARLDPAVYWSVVHPSFPRLDLETVARLAALGSIDHRLRRIRRFGSRPGFRSTRQIAERLRLDEQSLAAAIRTVGLDG